MTFRYPIENSAITRVFWQRGEGFYCLPVSSIAKNGWGAPFVDSQNNPVNDGLGTPGGKPPEVLLRPKLNKEEDTVEYKINRKSEFDVGFQTWHTKLQKTPESDKEKPLLLSFSGNHLGQLYISAKVTGRHPTSVYKTSKFGSRVFRNGKVIGKYNDGLIYGCAVIQRFIEEDEQQREYQFLVIVSFVDDQDTVAIKQIKPRVGKVDEGWETIFQSKAHLEEIENRDIGIYPKALGEPEELFEQHYQEPITKWVFSEDGLKAICTRVAYYNTVDEDGRIQRDRRSLETNVFELSISNDLKKAAVVLQESNRGTINETHVAVLDDTNSAASSTTTEIFQKGLIISGYYKNERVDFVLEEGERSRQSQSVTEFSDPNDIEKFVPYSGSSSNTFRQVFSIKSDRKQYLTFSVEGNSSVTTQGTSAQLAAIPGDRVSRVLINNTGSFQSSSSGVFKIIFIDIQRGLLVVSKEDQTTLQTSAIREVFTERRIEIYVDFALVKTFKYDIESETIDLSTTFVDADDGATYSGVKFVSSSNSGFIPITRETSSGTTTREVALFLAALYFIYDSDLNYFFGAITSDKFDPQYLLSFRPDGEDGDTQTIASFDIDSIVKPLGTRVFYKNIKVL